MCARAFVSLGLTVYSNSYAVADSAFGDCYHIAQRPMRCSRPKNRAFLIELKKWFDWLNLSQFYEKSVDEGFDSLYVFAGCLWVSIWVLMSVVLCGWFSDWIYQMMEDDPKACIAAWGDAVGMKVGKLSLSS